MRRAVVIIGLLLIVAAYVFGFWPQYQDARQARMELQSVTRQLNQARAELGLCVLQQRLLAVIQQASAKNYGDAATLSTQFFNQASEESQRQIDPSVKAKLSSILKQRDAVTSDLAKADPASLDALQGIEGTVFALVDQALKGTGAGNLPSGSAAAD